MRKQQWRRPKLNPKYTKSMCRCGHVGDGMYSEHANSIAYGHGPCKECARCAQFSWARWLTVEEQNNYLAGLPVEGAR